MSLPTFVTVENKSLPESLHIAGVITNVVPYHSARWSAFAEATGVKTSLIEVTNFDPFSVLAYSQVSPRVTKHTLFNHRLSGKAGIRKAEAALYALLSHIKPDIVVLSGYSLYHALFTLKWALRNHKHAVLCSESSEHDEPRRPLKEFVKSQVIRMSSAALVGGTTHAKYLTRLGLEKDRIHLGYDVVDNKHFACPSSVIDLKYSSASQPRVFLMCSRFTEKKNLFFAIQSFEQYVRECNALKLNPWRLRVLGSGPLFDSLVEYTKSHGLADLVTFPGAISYADLPKEYRLANAFVHASKTEQWGLVVNEAMSAGLPVMVSDRCGCVSELVTDGNGYTFDPYDLKSLCDAMLKMTKLKDSELKAMSQSSLSIIEKWSPSRFADGLMKAIFSCELRPWRRPSSIQRISLELATLKSLNQTIGV